MIDVTSGINDAVSSPDSERGPRVHLSFVILCLAVVLVPVGLATSWCFRRIESKYSHLVSRTAQDLRFVQEISYCSELTMETMLQLPYVQSADERTRLVGILTEQRVKTDRLYAQLANDAGDNRTRQMIDALAAKRRDLLQATDRFASSSQIRLKSETDVVNWQRLMTALTDYHRYCRDLAKNIETASLRSNEDVGKSIEKLRLLFFLMGICPIALCSLVLLGLFYFIRTTPIEVELSSAT
jgi:hypothetical protein